MLGRFVLGAPLDTATQHESDNRLFIDRPPPDSDIGRMSAPARWEPINGWVMKTMGLCWLWNAIWDCPMSTNIVIRPFLRVLCRRATTLTTSPAVNTAVSGARSYCAISYYDRRICNIFIYEYTVRSLCICMYVSRITTDIHKSH